MANHLTLLRYKRPGYNPIELDKPVRIQKRLRKIYKILNARKEVK